MVTPWLDREIVGIANIHLQDRLATNELQMQLSVYHRKARTARPLKHLGNKGGVDARLRSNARHARVAVDNAALTNRCADIKHGEASEIILP